MEPRDLGGQPPLTDSGRGVFQLPAPVPIERFGIEGARDVLTIRVSAIASSMQADSRR
jgi:hypothetical protein